jgi:hypothetical protein
VGVGVAGGGILFRTGACHRGVQARSLGPALGVARPLVGGLSHRRFVDLHDDRRSGPHRLRHMNTVGLAHPGVKQ